MAAYAAAATLAQPTVHKIGKLGVLHGSIAITNYNSTRAAITAITGRFKGTPTVILGGVTTTGHIVIWDSGSVKAFDPAGTLGLQVANDVNIGSVGFVAVGVAP